MPSATAKFRLQQEDSGKNYGAGKIRDMKKVKPNPKPTKGKKTPQTHKNQGENK